jgi:hypothetical protein
MKPRKRDNLIYLVVGLGIAALVVEQDFYAESHHGIIIRLSTFAFRAATSTLLLGYFVGRETRKAGATIAVATSCVLLASLLQLTISFGFRHTVGELSSISYVGLASVEFFLIVRVTTRVVSRFRARRDGTRAK